MSPSDSTTTDSGRLRGLHPERVIELAIGPEATAAPGSGRSDLPAAEELSALLPEYDVKEIAGRGGMGAVYRAVQRKLARMVAIKVLPVETGDTPGFAERFRREAMTTAGLTHPDIVAVHDTGETVAGHLFYVMDFVDGEDLAKHMARERPGVEESVRILTTVCGAVEAAHARGIVHRDIKPSNILLTQDGKPKLADFGLALLTEKNLEYSRLTLGGTTLGTLEYAAPEQLAGAGASPASDQYSLGVLTYELLTGELPRGVFDPPSVRNPAVDAAFDGIVLRALQSDPTRRYESVAEFREALLHAANRRVQEKNRERKLRQQVARRARVAAILAGVALLTLGSALYAWRAKQEANKRRSEAVKAEAKTDELIQFLLTDLRRRLEPTGNLGAMDSVLERAVEHYREKHALAGGSADAAAQLADVLVAKADVIGVRGLTDEAEALYSEALTLAESARRAAPKETGRGLRVVQALRDRSEHHMTCGRYVEALADARRMLREAGDLAAQSPGMAASRAVAAAHRAIANALGYLKELDECRREYLAAQEVLTGLAKANPGDESIAESLAGIDMSLGSLAEEEQDFARMLHHFTAWHEYVTRRYGPDHEAYSFSAFRMGVAMVKCGRPAEAVPFLRDAIRLAERMVAARPGHRSNLGHLSWCLRVMIEALDGSGQSAKAGDFRRRRDEVSAELAQEPETGTFAPEEEFEALAKREPTHSEWWAFCQKLQSAAEREADPDARRAWYVSWIGRARRAAGGRPAGDFIHTVPAFIHNRLAVLLTSGDPAAAAQHAGEALAIRQAIAEAHPDDAELWRNVLSSAEHLATAAVRGNSDAGALAAFARFAEAAAAVPVEALAGSANGPGFAKDAATLLKTAAARWPGRRAQFASAGADLAAQLIDRLPDAATSATLGNLRQNLRLR
jgi:serine/threonine protein kinase